MLFSTVALWVRCDGGPLPVLALASVSAFQNTSGDFNTVKTNNLKRDRTEYELNPYIWDFPHQTAASEDTSTSAMTPMITYQTCIDDEN